MAPKILRTEVKDSETIKEVALEGLKDNLAREVWRLAWPAFAESLLGTMTQIVDTAMVGRLGPVAVASTGIGMQPLFLAQGIFMGINVATNAIVARYVGAKERENAQIVTGQSLLVSVLLSVIIFLPLLFVSRNIVIFMGAKDDVIKYGTIYLSWIIPGLIFMTATMGIVGALRGAGDTKTPMYINALVNIINVLGNYVLIYGKLGFPMLGVEGAAIATTFSRLIGAILLIVVIFNKDSAMNTNLRYCLRLDKEFIVKLFNIAYPVTLERIVLSVALLFYVRIIASLGTIPYAAHNIAMNAESLSFMPGLAFATAATTLVGQSLGAGDPERAERATYTCLRLGIYFMGSMGILFYFFPEFFMRIYTDNVDVIGYGSLALRVVAFSQIPMAIAFIVSGALRGAGDTKTVLYATAVGVWCIRLVLAHLFVNLLGMGFFGAWLVMIFDWLFRVVWMLVRFKNGSWKKIEI
ncbi:MATE family efflux transporter [bacterium]|nr:MATE family efflux transporter [bacterium]